MSRAPGGPSTEVVRKLSLAERLYNIDWLRRLLIIVLLAAAWQAYTTLADVQPLIFPSFGAVLGALESSIASGELLERCLVSVRVLLIGYAAGLALAMVLTGLAVSHRLGADLLTTLTSMFNPLPSVALLPLGLLWFGLGLGSLVFVLIHSVMWPVALNTYAGFRAVSPTLRMVGRNYGLTGSRYIRRILIPAAFPSILAGLKIGWAFAWRTLIAAELVFGVTGSSGGLGWFIYQNRFELNTDYVFAGLFTIIAIGFLVENILFKAIEQRTVLRWGMQV